MLRRGLVSVVTNPQRKQNGRLGGRSSFRRGFSTVPLTPTVFVTDCVDPYWNLALEDHILEQRRQTDARGFQLLLWRNDKSVILGRNQNPWIECNFPLLRTHDIPIVRRSSGGGTVYHDLGNTNITIFAQEHMPERNLALIIAALKESFGLAAYISPRKDIFLNQKKISGSAYRITGKQCYHHLTLLRETDLSMLEAALRPTLSNLQTKATESVRSKVLNVTEVNPTITHESLCSSIATQFQKQWQPEAPVVSLAMADILAIEDVAQRQAELSSWENTYEHTPDFTQQLEKVFSWGHVVVTVKFHRGRIESCAVQGPPEAAEPLIILKAAMDGSKYKATDILERLQAQIAIAPLGGPSEQAIFGDLTQWLLSSLVH